MSIQELEQIEYRARLGLPIDCETVLTLTAYLRNLLQEKLNAEAVASELLKKADLSTNFPLLESK